MQRGRRPVAALRIVIAVVVTALAGCSGMPRPQSHVEGRPTPAPSSVAAPSQLVLPPASATPSALASPSGLTPAQVSASISPTSRGSPSNSATPRDLLSRSAPVLPATAYVDVSVATLWHSSTSPRSVDAAALLQPVGIRSWLASMSTSQRLALNGRVDSQLLLGERVVVDREQGVWAHVLVPDQPTPLDAHGYPGWIPLVQLSLRVPPAVAQDVVVSVPTAWLYIGSTRLYEVSMATRLPVLGADSGLVRSETPDGTAVSLRSTDVEVVPRGAAALPASGADVVRTARLFDGLPYLWGGTSGFGFDCSGLTRVIYAMRGVTIPRDADAQARTGTAVARNDLRPGDLIFFAGNGFVHHVGIYLGNGMMLHAPETGSVVQTVALSSEPYASEYAGARRYLSQ